MPERKQETTLIPLGSEQSSDLQEFGPSLERLVPESTTPQTEQAQPGQQTVTQPGEATQTESQQAATQQVTPSETEQKATERAAKFQSIYQKAIGVVKHYPEAYAAVKAEFARDRVLNEFEPTQTQQMQQQQTPQRVGIPGEMSVMDMTAAQLTDLIHQETNSAYKAERQQEAEQELRDRWDAEDRDSHVAAAEFVEAAKAEGVEFTQDEIALANRNANSYGVNYKSIGGPTAYRRLFLRELRDIYEAKERTRTLSTVESQTIDRARQLALAGSPAGSSVAQQGPKTYQQQAADRMGGVRPRRVSDLPA